MSQYGAIYVVYVSVKLDRSVRVSSRAMVPGSSGKVARRIQGFCTNRLINASWIIGSRNEDGCSVYYQAGYETLK